MPESKPATQPRGETPNPRVTPIMERGLTAMKAAGMNSQRVYDACADFVCELGREAISMERELAAQEVQMNAVRYRAEAAEAALEGAKADNVQLRGLIEEIKLAAKVLGLQSRALPDHVRGLQSRLDAADRDAGRYRYLVEADPDSGPHVVIHRQDDWGNWRNDILTGIVLDEALDSALSASAESEDKGGA